MNAQGLILLLVGIFTIYMIVKKPKFYWESRKAKQMRSLMGDKGTAFFYLALGAFLIFYGIKTI